MQYLALIYGNEAEAAKVPQSEQESIFNEYMALRQDMIAKKQYVGGNRLAATSTATTVRIRDGKKVVTDGPFAETKEQLAGYFLIEAKDLDEAISVAPAPP